MTVRPRAVVIHGHFYQPPREDPWLDDVEAEPSAAPFHDWNQRVEQECYRAVVAARVPAPGGRIARMSNTLADMSFDFGPTLLRWMEREAPRTYAAVLAADRLSVERRDGHGNAIATPYHHVILPLCSRRDKITEIRWGIADFRRRFGREPRGMWLPEAAVDDETVEVLAAEGIAFTVLAPHQVTRAPARGLPGRITRGARSLAVFVYDGAISHDVAFGPLVTDARAWSARLLAAGDAAGVAELVSVATDGETYGHHHRFAEMALAALLEELDVRADVRVTNFAAFLAQHPPHAELALVSPSSWSCPHGVERWRGDCGCKANPRVPSHQRWRAPLREALDWLAGELHSIFEREGASLYTDAWMTRNEYGAVLDQGSHELARFAYERLHPPASPERVVRARELLELERDALRMFTSCGWFFDDVGGIEARQNLRYAARAIDLAGPEAARLEAGLLERLARAPGNDPAIGSARDVYVRDVRRAIPPAVRVVAGYAAARRATPPAEPRQPGCYDVREEEGDRLVLTHCRTGRAQAFRVRVERPRPGQIWAAVTPGDGEEWERVALADFPERWRLSVAASLRRAVVERWLGAAELDALAAGATDLADLVGRRLLDAVEALEGDSSPGAAERVLDLADLLELLDRPVPFEAQTAFYQVRARAAAERVAALMPLALRLGFTEEP